MNEHNDAERCIIGAILLDDKVVLPKIVDIIKPLQFANKSLAKIYEVTLQMEYNNEPIDVITLHNRLLDVGFETGMIKQVLVQCMEICPTIRNAVAHAEIIAKDYKQRKMKEIAQQILTQSIDHQDTETIIEAACNSLTELAMDNQSTGLMSIGDMIIRDINGMFDKERLKQRINIGISNVDRILDGIYKNNLVILGARPSVGKTALAMQIAKSVATQGKRVAFFNLEMGSEQVIQRYLSSVSRVSLQKIKNIDVSADEMSTVMRACDVLFPIPLSICSNPFMTVAKIKAECRFKNCDLIVIDYLQLLQPRTGKRHSNRTEAVGEISRDLKVMAMELNVPVIVLSQLNRESDEEKEPSIGELRESGSIEQDADTVMLLWKYDIEESIIGCKICKNRNGITGRAGLTFDGAHMEFRSSNIGVETKKFKGVPWG